MGGTMRLGLRPTVFESGTENNSNIRGLYAGAGKIWERHRHRYEVNPEYIERLTKSGLPFVGKDEKGERMQVLELSGISFLWTRFSSTDTGSRSPFLCGTTSPPRVLF